MGCSFAGLCLWQITLTHAKDAPHRIPSKFSTSPYGTSENAVRTQIWIAISVYVLVAIIKKQLRLDVTLHTLLQILSLTLFEKLPLQQAFKRVDPVENNLISDRQLKLFEF